MLLVQRYLRCVCEAGEAVPTLAIAMVLCYSVSCKPRSSISLRLSCTPDVLLSSTRSQRHVSTLPRLRVSCFPSFAIQMTYNGAARRHQTNSPFPPQPAPSLHATETLSYINQPSPPISVYHVQYFFALPRHPTARQAVLADALRLTAQPMGIQTPYYLSAPLDSQRVRGDLGFYH